MITKHELQVRVTARRQEFDAGTARLNELRGKLNVFIDDIKTHSVIYNLIKNLSVWKDLENLTSGSDTENNSMNID